MQKAQKTACPLRVRLRRIAAAVTALFFCVLPAATPYTVWASMAPASEISAPADPMLTAEHYANETFVTDMPVIVLELAEGSTASEASDYFLSASVQAYEGKGNSPLRDTPSSSHSASLRNMTEKANESDRKHDYYLSFEDAGGLLGLGGTGEYLLLGAMGDRSLVRNYIGYTISAGIWEDTPGAALCELFFRTPEGCLYQGVYTLVAMPPDDGQVLLQRSLSSDGVPVDTYSSLNDPTAAKMYIPFMESTSWEARYEDIIGGVSRAEQVLYSTDPTVFYSASGYFDLYSVITWFILGELMENYTGMSECYYYFNAETGKISVAPIWNFAYALDNEESEPAFANEIRYDEAAYLAEFFKSPSFTETVQETYLALRGEVLNEPALMRLVDAAVAHVSPAVQRDWARWDSYQAYTLEPVAEREQEDGTLQAVAPFSRQTTSFEDEILRIRYHLRTHSLYMAVGITQFEFTEQEVSREVTLTSNPLWPILFIVVMLLLVVFARRYGA